ncbi:hypothetical protein SteCoe_8644 [Stentor coeruleus]|uniref:Uncharacterized protein n=1 Tax=Stentor coeruleus TaxID=5963 RepID=A0A1R2CJX5_9CILI|nr:hypothetical protein SteCoe_8644 [Stentor coeruleus]
MGESPVCEECYIGDITKGKLSEDGKAEEYTCLFCNNGEAECLYQGKPSCISCKSNKKNKDKSPATSIRSDSGSRKGNFNTVKDFSRPVPPQSIAEQFKKIIEINTHRRGDSSVSVQFYKAHKFLQKYTSNCFNEILCLYNSKRDGMKSTTFHEKCDECKYGIIMILRLCTGYEIAGFTWKGIKKGNFQINDSQMGGAFIRDTKFELVPFKDNIVYSLPEGIRFSSENDLYVNFDDISKCLCTFDSRLKGNQIWSSYIEEISVYKLQIAE